MQHNAVNYSGLLNTVRFHPGSPGSLHHTQELRQTLNTSSFSFSVWKSIKAHSLSPQRLQKKRPQSGNIACLESQGMKPKPSEQPKNRFLRSLCAEVTQVRGNHNERHSGTRVIRIDKTRYKWIKPKRVAKEIQWKVKTRGSRLIRTRINWNYR